jgi:hypothetical protein
MLARDGSCYAHKSNGWDWVEFHFSYNYDELEAGFANISALGAAQPNADSSGGG